MNITDTDVSILIVDDAKLPCITIHRALSGVGYHDIRTCNSAAEALKMIEQRPADVVLADWLMPNMDGLQLTKHIRQTDEEVGRYTAVIVITAMDRSDAVSDALAVGADDFIHKSPNNVELVARVANAARLSRLQNTVLQTMKVFAKQNQDLVDKSGTDPESGAYTKAFFTDRVGRHLANVQARGGAVLCMMVKIVDADAIRAKGAPLYSEVVTGIYSRLQQLVRPADEIARINDDTFAVQILYADASEYHASSFNRVLQQMNLREIKTSQGFMSVLSAMSHCFFKGGEHAEAAPAEPFIAMAEAALAEAVQTNVITSVKWKPD